MKIALPHCPLIAWSLAAGLFLCRAGYGAIPTFENRTPAGFSTRDSTARQDFIEGQQVTVRADLNQAATPTYPVIGDFYNLERSKAVETTDVDGMRADVAVSGTSTVHMAWISQEVVSPVSTPVYFVRYARSNNNGATFSDPVSVSGSLRFDLLTLNGAGTSFSTLDLEVDSRGNPRIAYAFNSSPDGNTADFSTTPNNVYFNHSEDGGATWLPGNSAVVVNDTTTKGNTKGRDAAFPRMVIDQRDNIFITYVRGSSPGTGTDDIMLAKVNRQTSPFTMERVGSLGTVGSTGGVRITLFGDRQTGPSIDRGSGDVLHVIYYNWTGKMIEHKTLLADSWSNVSPTGWDQDNIGAKVDGFDYAAAPTSALEVNAIFYFPTVVVDRVSSPNRIFALYKYGDATYETIFFNKYTYDNAVGGSAGWSAAQASPVWSTANTAVFKDGDLRYNVELNWKVTEPVAAVVDDRRPDRGELHIVFTAGYSNTTGTSHEQDVYYGFYNDASWTLPEKVADDDSDGSLTEDGIANTDVFLAAPMIAKRTGDPNVYLSFVGGTAEGLGVDNVTNTNHHAYFKVLGRAVTSEDKSVPVGGYQYDLDYTPVNPHQTSSEVADQAVYVHVADNLTGAGLGATGKRSTDGFLAGEWETVGSTLADDDKNFEGRLNEDTSTDNEWGDDDDKIGLLVKLNVLGSDSATNLQVVTNSTASSAGTGKGARTVRVGTSPLTGSFSLVAGIGTFFELGANIDIIDSNTAPTVRITQPDGVADSANTSYPISYDLSDPDDNLGSTALRAALYFSPDSTLSSVQDIRIFGTLIADENDATSVSASGTDDFLEGTSQVYTWDEPPTALRDSLFASILKVPTGNYYIYLVADDQKNLPVYTRSKGPLAVRHKPIVDQVDPSSADTVDTGVRTGLKANPYDLDFRVRDFDRQGATEVQLFYSSVSGLVSVSAIGRYPNLSFALGKSHTGKRAIAIPGSDTLTSAHTEYSWDVTAAVVDNGVASTVKEGSYFIYAVACDSVYTTVGQSIAQLAVKHSPSFVFYEPPRDTHRQLNTGSQPMYTVQWQKGAGDQDFDDNATIDLYFTTDSPATINYESYPDSLLRDADTRTIVKGLKENAGGASDMYVWSFRNPTDDVPQEGAKVWLYARISDSHNNSSVALGGALTLTHDPRITLLTSRLSDYTPSFLLHHVLRLEWDDYLVDDGLSTDNAYIRLYAVTNPSAYTTLSLLDTDVNGSTVFLLNSSNGALTGTIASVREDSANFLDWNTRLFGSAASYDVYAAISKDPTFNNNSATTLSKSSMPLTIGMALPDTANFSLAPSDRPVAIGDTLTLDVMVQYDKPINFVQVVLKLGDNSFSIVDQSAASGTQPFIDLGRVFAGTSPIENTYKSSASQLRFSKSTFGGETVGTKTQPAALARFQLVATSNLQDPPSVVFSKGETGTVLGQVGKSDPVDKDGDLLSIPNPNFKRVRRGRIDATVELEGHTAPLGTGNHSTLLDVHLRLPGSAIDISDLNFRQANDGLPSTTDTVEVQTNSSGALNLYSVPAGRYVLTVKDTSHVSGRTDTIVVRNGETVTISSGNNNGFFASDLRGDPAGMLASSGRQLIAGDVSEDNEINEDDVNLIIAAWGTTTTVANFKQADINNDNSVGAPDLTVTTSNFGNSEGFGAPPVYKPVAGRPANSEAVVEVRPQQLRPLVPGQEVEVELSAERLDGLAGYELNLDYDPRYLRLVPGEVKAGAIFAANPRGAVFEARPEEGRVRLMGARIGKRWEAHGAGSLAHLRFEVLKEGAENTVRLDGGMLLAPDYERSPVRQGKNLADWLLPTQPALDQNYPNPFNPSTVIPFSVPQRQEVRLAIYDVLGQRVRTLVSGPLAPGFHTLVWDGRDDLAHQVAAGLYFYQLELGSFRQTRKMVLVK
ncbi:MAG: T9SS type A sorting domain-containing protein [Candidatus Latescibacteria bacterium]|nr:T9SS type A sorting domain-containing protein [Candidatus Latescibacterota bacterium]